MNKPLTSLQTQRNQLMDKDKWHANELGLNLSKDSSAYWLTFAGIKPHWFNETAKNFIYSQAPTRTYNTCSSYIKALRFFGYFIAKLNVHIEPKDVDRKIIVDYIHHLSAVKQLKPATVCSYLGGLRRFFEVNLKEQWLVFSKSSVIYDEDFPKIPKPLPKFIPDCVIQQLLDHLPALQEQHQRLIMLFLETGRRRGEIFTLEYNCLHKDNEGDCFMKVNDRKMGKSYMIPITQGCAQHIRQQQAYVSKITSSQEFLFVRKHKDVVQPMKSRPVHRLLNDFAKNKNIVDDNGHIWNFHFHQFRHTVGTRMINADVPQHIVQRFLGHESAEMTARYATVHDATLKKAFVKFQKQLSNSQEKDILEIALTDSTILIDYQRDLEKTKKLITMAQLKGWKEQLSMNIKKQQELENIITKIKGSKSL